MSAQVPGEGWVRIGISYSGDITALALSPNYEEDKTLYIGVRGNGIWMSNDRGEEGSWNMCPAIPSNATVTGIALPKDYKYDNGIPCFAVTEQGFFYSSTDDFATVQYSHDFYAGKTNPCTCIVVGGRTAFDGSIWVGTWGEGVYRNTNYGNPAYWTHPSAEISALDYCNSLTITNETTQKIWASSDPVTGFAPIYRYESGYSWTAFGGSSLYGENVLSIHSSWTKYQDMWAGTATKGMWRSTDYGASWSVACDGDAGGGLSFQVQSIRTSPAYVDDHEVWEGRSDGLRKSTDLGVNCAANGFSGSRVNVIGFAPSYHGSSGFCDAFVGTEDALYRINCDSAPAAKTPPVIDGKAVAMAHRGKGIFLGSKSKGLFKSVDSRTMVEYNNFPNGLIPEIVAICLHPDYYEGGTHCSDETTLFVAANFPDCPEDNGVYKSIDGGNSWVIMTGGEWPTLDVEMRDLAISPNYATDNCLYAATSIQLFRWDGSTPCWYRVAKDNAFTNYTFVAVTPQYNKLSTCTYSSQSGAPCNMVVVGTERSSTMILAVSYNNGGYFYEKGSVIQNPTGVTFPKNYCTGSQPSVKALVSSSTQGVRMTTDILFSSFTAANSGIPSSLNVADIASDPDWIDSATPTDPYLVCAVPVSSTPSTRDFGAYYSGDAGGSWNMKRRGKAISVDFETPYGSDNYYAMAGFQRDATYGTDPPYGAFVSGDSGSTYDWLSGYWSLPEDVFSSVAHERDPNYVFAASPSMGVFVSTDKGESFHPYNVGKGGSDGPCCLDNGYGITMLANRRGLDLDALYVGTTSGIKSRYIYYDSVNGIDLEHEDALGAPSGWRHSTLLAGGATTGYWERLEVVPNSSLNYPVWAVSPQHISTPGQGFAALPAGSFEGWVFQNDGLGSSPNAKGVRLGYGSGSGGIQPLISGSPITESVAQGEWDFYSIDVTNPNLDLEVFLDDPDDYGAKDPDLYVRYGAPPTLSSYDYCPYTNGDETVCVTPILGENFDESWGTYGNNPPPGWTILDFGDEDPKAWNTNDWYRFLNGTYGYSARIHYSPVENQSDELRSPTFDIPSTMTSASLDFDHYFHVYLAGNATGKVWLYDGSWHTLATYTTETGGMVHASVDLTPYIGKTGCFLSFAYTGSDDWYWIVDNVRVTGASPQRLKTGAWYVGVRGYAAGDNGYTLTATLDSSCTGAKSDPPGTGKDPKYANYTPTRERR